MAGGREDGTEPVVDDDRGKRGASGGVEQGTRCVAPEVEVGT